MASNRTFTSVELVSLEYNINKYIVEGQYDEAAKLIKEYSDLYDFEINISDKPSEILEKLRNQGK